MDILFACLHQIDVENQKVKRIQIESTQTEDLQNYIEDTVNQILDNEVKRRYWFSGEETQISTAVENYIQDNYEPYSDQIAEKLMTIETETQRRYGHLTELQKGSLFQVVIRIGGIKRIFLLKAENSGFLDEQEMKKRGGLAISKKQKIYKAFVAKVSEVDSIDKIYVYDSQRRLSKYWWDDFLELIEEKTNTYNTGKAFNSIVKRVLNPIKRISSPDYYNLHQRTLQYFKGNTTFNLEDFISEVISNYPPESDDVKIDDIVDKVSALPEQYDFDSQFEIETDALSSKDINRKIELRDNLELKIKGVVEDFKNIIFAEIGKDGKKYLRIQTNSGYDEFKAQ